MKWPMTPAEARAMRKPALAVAGSTTSDEAAARIEPVRGRLQTLVYMAIKRGAGWSVTFAQEGDDRGHYVLTSRVAKVGCTDEEGIAATGIPASTYRPRRVELVEQNRVVDSGRTRPTHSGRRAVVWIASE